VNEPRLSVGRERDARAPRPERFRDCERG
jgi:hypothetical protein